MRRTVMLEIDTASFSRAFKGLSGDEAKEVLVMLVCGGHAVASHSTCLVDVGIKPAPPSESPSSQRADSDGKIARAAREFMTALGPFRHSDVLAALEDRPRPGCKARAREAMKLLLGAVYDLRKGIEYSEPFRLVGSTGECGKEAGEKGMTPNV